MSICVCGTGLKASDCCLPIIQGERQAQTALELMRSRYTAYVTQAIDFIVESHDPETRGETDRAALEEWSKSSKWMGLEILSTEKGTATDKTGVVEFKASFQQGDTVQVHHEKALFTKRANRWFFTDGQIPIPTIKREGEKIGRNDPCLCGSGKKYKKCCG